MAKGFGDDALRLYLDMPYEQVLERVIAALKAEGFGVLTEVDVRKTLQEKLGVDFYPYTILGVCNPPLAYRALQAEPQVGLLLPCNVIVFAEGEGSAVGILDPLAMLDLIQNPALEPIAEEARSRLQRVAEALRAGEPAAKGGTQ